MAGQGPKAGSIAESTTTSPTLRATPSGSNQVPSIAYSLSMDSKVTWFREKTGTLLASAGHNPPAVASLAGRSGHELENGPDGSPGQEPDYIVRRLMPVECERIQGFPDGWTDVEISGKAPLDTWRYKALGNSMTVNVIHWIGARLQSAIDAATREVA